MIKDSDWFAFYYTQDKQWHYRRVLAWTEVSAIVMPDRPSETATLSEDYEGFRGYVRGGIFNEQERHDITLKERELIMQAAHRRQFERHRNGNAAT